MITTITGANRYEASNKLRELVKSFSAANGEMSIEQIDCQEVEWHVAKAALENLPFLVSKKLVVLKYPSFFKEITEGHKDILTNIAEQIDVVIYEPKIDRRTALYKFLKKTTEFYEFSERDESQLTEWLVGIVSEQKAKLSKSDARYMINRMGVDQALLHNEINKLIAYSEDISRENIDMLCEASPSSTIFELLDSAFSGNSKKTIQLYEEQRMQNVEPQQIIAMLAWQLHVMAIVIAAGDMSDREIASNSKISPYTITKSKRLTSGMSKSKILQLVHSLAKLDESLKSRPVNADDALKAYLLAIS